MAPTTESTNPLLLTQKDWPIWFQFIHQEASFAKIWDYMDPDKAENEIKENTKPEIPSIAAAPAAPAAPAAAPATPAAAPATPATAPAASAAAPTAPAATPASTRTATPASSNQQNQQTPQSIETQRMLFELYKLQRQDYLKREEKLHTFAALLHTTVGTNFSRYLKNLTTPHSVLRQLKKVAKPSQATLQQMVLDDLKKWKQGPKHQTLESWLQLHITIIQNGEELEEGLIEATESSVVRAFVQDCKEICPALYYAFIQKVAKRSEKLEMATIIKEFNLLYKHPNSGPDNDSAETHATKDPTLAPYC